jgi:hypothetical protein
MFTLSVCIMCYIVYNLGIKKSLTVKYNREKTRKYPKKSNDQKFDKLVLFDIDGTLTHGYENTEMVDFYLKKNYAVGVCTAGIIYSPQNIHTFDWMPENLLTFMRKTNFITFNNVGSEIIAGEYIPGVFFDTDSLTQHYSSVHQRIGSRKGYAAVSNAYRLGITDTTNIIMYDDMVDFLIGIRLYNKNIKLFCAGADCGVKEGMGLNSVRVW